MQIEVRKNGVVYCVYADESTLPNEETLRCMKTAGYKLYQNGKLYKANKNDKKHNKINVDNE